MFSRSIPWRYPSAGFDISSGHVKRADADGILVVHCQEVAANNHGLCNVCATVL